jgi:hypothetical protein
MPKSHNALEAGLRWWLKCAWSASTCRSRYRLRVTRSTAGRSPASATSTSTARIDTLLRQDQDRDFALAVRRQGRRRVLDSNDELRGVYVRRAVSHWRLPIPCEFAFASPYRSLKQLRCAAMDCQSLSRTDRRCARIYPMVLALQKAHQ